MTHPLRCTRHGARYEALRLLTQSMFQFSIFADPTTHQNTLTKVLAHWLVPPPALCRPSVDLFTWPALPEGFVKAKGQSGQTVPPVANFSTWKTESNSRLLFFNNRHLAWLDVAFSHETSLFLPSGLELSCPFVAISGMVAGWKREIYPLSPCLTCSSAAWAMQGRRPWECEVPLAVPGPAMSWLCGMWDMHSLHSGGTE